MNIEGEAESLIPHCIDIWLRGDQYESGSFGRGEVLELTVGFNVRFTSFWKSRAGRDHCIVVFQDAADVSEMDDILNKQRPSKWRWKPVVEFAVTEHVMDHLRDNLLKEARQRHTNLEQQFTAYANKARSHVDKLAVELVSSQVLQRTQSEEIAVLKAHLSKAIQALNQTSQTHTPSLTPVIANQSLALPVAAIPVVRTHPKRPISDSGLSSPSAKRVKMDAETELIPSPSAHAAIMKKPPPWEKIIVPEKQDSVITRDAKRPNEYPSNALRSEPRETNERGVITEERLTSGAGTPLSQRTAVPNEEPALSQKVVNRSAEAAKRHAVLEKREKPVEAPSEDDAMPVDVPANRQEQNGSVQVTAVALVTLLDVPKPAENNVGTSGQGVMPLQEKTASPRAVLDKSVSTDTEQSIPQYYSECGQQTDDVNVETMLEKGIQVTGLSDALSKDAAFLTKSKIVSDVLASFEAATEKAWLLHSASEERIFRSGGR